MVKIASRPLDRIRQYVADLGGCLPFCIEGHPAFVNGCARCDDARTALSTPIEPET